MLFNSAPYLFFFPVIFALYWLAPAVLKRPLLLAASYFFYMSWLPAYGLLLFSLTAVNYVLGLLLDRFRGRARLIFIAGLIVNLGTLCFYKYTNFILTSLVECLQALSPWLHVQATSIQMPAMNIILPLGISFFAFEFIHYLSDVYRGDRPIRNVLDFGLFAAFFPSQIAGPIKRYQDFVAQLAKKPSLDAARFHAGLVLILQGLFKKVALSDNLSPLVAAGFGQDYWQLGTLDAWLASLAFALQIYFDFSGYTDMGRGSAMLLGISLPDNFNLPYIASSLSDFWKRWHISLSTWLRDYLYIPLGGGRTGKLRKHLNLMVTMLLGGLWHGAAWHFVAWGGFHGLGLVVCHEYSDRAKASPALARFHESAAGRIASALLTFLCVLVGWVLFRAESVGQATEIMRHMFSLAPSGAVVTLFLQSTVPVGLAVYAIYAASSGSFNGLRIPVLPRLRELVVSHAPVRAAVYLGAFVAALGFGPTHAEPFIYFQF